MKLTKGTPLEFITRALSALGVVHYYKDYMMEAYQLYAEQYDAGVEPKEILSRFMVIKSDDPQFDSTKEAVMNYLKKRREANECVATLLNKLKSGI